VHKVHKILGTPSKELLGKFQKVASHMEFNFPKIDGSGIASLVPHVSADAVDLISKLLIYNHEHRISAG